MKLLSLLTAAYCALCCETVLVPEMLPGGRSACVVWLLLPYFAVFESERTAILIAGIYGFAIDALSESVLGLNVLVCVAVTAILQCVLKPTWMSSYLRVSAVTATCAIFISTMLFVFKRSFTSDTIELHSGLLQIVISSAVGASAFAMVARLLRLSSSEPDREVAV